MHAIESILSRPEVERLGWVLLHFIWQGTIAAGLLAIALLALRRASANARYLAACAMLVAMTACLPLTWLFAPQPSLTGRRAIDAPAGGTGQRGALWARPVPAIDRSSTRFPGEANGDRSATTRDDRSVERSSESVAPGILWQKWIAFYLPWLTTGWLAGVLVLSLRMANGWSTVHRIRRAAAQPADDSRRAVLSRLSERLGIRWPVTLMESALIEVPTMIGWLRPVILWPPSVLAGLSIEQFESLLAHELAHVRRHDYLVNLAQTAIETLLFYHPAVWWVSNRIRQERECCCDDLAVATCGNRLSYARALATLEELRPRPRQLALAADGGRLIARIRRIVGQPVTRRSGGRHWLLGITLSATSLAVVIALGLSNFATGDEPTKKPADPSQPAKPTEKATPVESSKENASADRLGYDLDVQEIANRDATGLLPEKIGDRIKQLPHVTAVTGSLMDGSWSIIGLPADSRQFKQLKLSLGALPAPGDRHKVVVGKLLAEKRGYKVGDTIKLYNANLQVVGILSPLAVFDYSIQMPLEDLQEFMNAKRQVTEFLVSVDIPKHGSLEDRWKRTELRHRIEALADELVVTDMNSRESVTQRSVPQENLYSLGPSWIEIFGKVVDDARGKPVEVFRRQYGRLVSNQIGWGIGEGFQNAGDSAGQFKVLLDWDAGNRMRIIAGGYVPEPILSESPKRGAKAVQGIVVRLKHGRQISGRLLDFAGNPVAGGSLFVVGALEARIANGKVVCYGLNGWTEDESSTRFTSDADGKFTLTGVGWDANWIAISCPALDLWTVPAPNASESQNDFEIRLPQAGKLVMHYDIAGGPDEAHLGLWPSDARVPNGGGIRPVGKFIRHDPNGGASVWDANVLYGHDVVIKQRGELAFDNLPPGDYNVVRTKTLNLHFDNRVLHLDRRVVTVGSNRTTTVGFVRDKGAQIAGQILGLDRDEVLKAKPHALVISVQKPGTATGAIASRFDEIDLAPIDDDGKPSDGRFATEKLPPGQYSVMAQLFGYDGWDHYLHGSPTSPEFAGEALITVPESGEPPAARIELHRFKNAPQVTPPAEGPVDATAQPRATNPEAQPAQKSKRDDKSNRVQRVPDGRGFAWVVQKANQLQSSRFLPEELGDRLEKLPHVMTVEGRLCDSTGIDPILNATVLLCGLPPGSVWNDWTFVSGRCPKAGDRHKVVVGKKLASKIGWEVGESIKLYDAAVEIVGIYESTWDGENDIIVMPLSDIQEFMKRPGQVEVFAMRVDIPKDGSPEHEAQAAELRKQIAALGDGIIAFPFPDEPPKSQKPDESRPAEKHSEKPKPAEQSDRPQKAADDRGLELVVQRFGNNPELNNGLPEGLGDASQKLFAPRRLGNMSELNNGLPEELGDRIQKLPHVKTVAGGLMDMVSFPDQKLLAVIINGLAADSPPFQRWKLKSGRMLKAGDRRKAIVGTTLAANLGKKVGDTINIYDTDVAIIGIFESANVFENGSIGMLLSDLQEFMSRPHQVTGFLVHTDIPEDGSAEHKAQSAELRKQIEALGDGIAAIDAALADPKPADKPKAVEQSNRADNVSNGRGLDLVVQRVAGTHEIKNGEVNYGLPEELGDRIGKLPHVKAVMPGLVDVVSFLKNDLAAAIVVGVPPDSPLLQDLSLKTGRGLKAEDRHNVIIGTMLAANLGKQVGDTINIYDTDMTIIGIFESANLFENSRIVISLSDLQEFMDARHSSVGIPAGPGLFKHARRAPNRMMGFLVRTDLPREGSPEHQAQMAELRTRIESLGDGIAVAQAGPPETQKPDESQPPEKAAVGPKPAEQSKPVEKAVSSTRIAAGADRAWDKLGMKLSPISAERFKQLQSQSPRLGAYRGGLTITEVRADSSAARQRVRPGDILVGLHIWATVSVENVNFVLNRADAAEFEPMRFYIVRGNDTFSGHVDAGLQKLSGPFPRSPTGAVPVQHPAGNGPSASTVPPR